MRVRRRALAAVFVAGALLAPMAASGTAANPLSAGAAVGSEQEVRTAFTANVILQEEEVEKLRDQLRALVLRNRQVRAETLIAIENCDEAKVLAGLKTLRDSQTEFEALETAAAALQAEMVELLQDMINVFKAYTQPEVPADRRVLDPFFNNEAALVRVRNASSASLTRNGEGSWLANIPERVERYPMSGLPPRTAALARAVAKAIGRHVTSIHWLGTVASDTRHEKQVWEIAVADLEEAWGDKEPTCNTAQPPETATSTGPTAPLVDTGTSLTAGTPDQQVSALHAAVAEL
jgi:hypothetical protein